MGESDRRYWLDDLLARYEGPLLRYVARLTGDLDRARDIVQDAFVRLVREREHGRPAREPNHTAEWLYAVCRNRAIDVHRKERRMKPLMLVEHETTPESVSPAETIERRDSAAAALKLLATLPGNQQEVVRLKFQDGLSYKEIAGVTGLSVSNVGFLIHTAIRTLRARMQPDGTAKHGMDCGTGCQPVLQTTPKVPS